MKTLWAAIQRHGFQAIISLVIIVFFAAHVTGHLRWSFIDEMELRSYDTRLNLTKPGGVDSRIVIVDIDEKSLSAIGRWPWKRDILASVVDQLFDYYQIDLLGFDAVFPEADKSSGLETLENLANNELQDQADFLAVLEKLRTGLDYDSRFAQSLKNRRIILGYAMIDEDDAARSGVLPKPAFSTKTLSPYALQPIEATGFASNMAPFEQASVTSGHFNALPDNDGITRRVPMFYAFQGNYYESLSLAIARVLLNEPELGLDVVNQGNYQQLEALLVGNRRIPVNSHLEALVPYRGEQDSYPYVSIVDVLYRQVEPERLRGAIVLIGTTAKGLFDLRATPVSEVYPGVEIHANLIAGILDNRILQADYGKGGELFFMILAGLSMTVLMLWVTPLWTTIAAVVLSVGLIWSNFYFWENLNLVLNLAPTLLMIWGLFLFNLSYGYFVETRNKRQLTGLFGQYIPPQLVDEMSQNPSAKFSMEGDSREMTVLFSDVRGFTSISESLNPRQLSELMNTFLTPMTHLIHEHRGTIDKYMGDAIMAFWGAPLRDAEHPRHALAAAMAMIDKLDTMQGEFKSRGWPQIKIGIGINTGVMNVGNMGSEFRMAYTVGTERV